MCLYMVLQWSPAWVLLNYYSSYDDLYLSQEARSLLENGRCPSCCCVCFYYSHYSLSFSSDVSFDVRLFLVVLTNLTTSYVTIAYQFNSQLCIRFQKTFH